MQEEECLQRARGSVDLVLDTTYCQPQYIFPKQEEVPSWLASLTLTAHTRGRVMSCILQGPVTKSRNMLGVAGTA